MPIVDFDNLLFFRSGSRSLTSFLFLVVSLTQLSLFFDLQFVFSSHLPLFYYFFRSGSRSLTSFLFLLLVGSLTWLSLHFVFSSHP